MEALLHVLSAHPPNSVVWGYLRVSDVHSLLRVNKAVRVATQRAFAVESQPKTTVYSIGQGFNDEIVAVHMTVVLHGPADQCLVYCDGLVQPSSKRFGGECRWIAQPNPRHGKILVTSVLRRLKRGDFKTIRLSMTNAREAHHVVLQQQLQHAQRRFNVSCTVAVPRHLSVVSDFVHNMGRLWHLTLPAFSNQLLSATLGSDGTASHCFVCAYALGSLAHQNPHLVTLCLSQWKVRPWMKRWAMPCVWTANLMPRVWTAELAMSCRYCGCCSYCPP